MPTKDSMQEFLDGSPFAVVGASESRKKYGNKVLRAYLQNDLEVYPVNPRASEIEGRAVYPDLAAIPETIHGVSMITPPEITERVLEAGIQLGIRHFWLQPGAESERALEIARDAGVDIIAGGPCILVALGYREN